MLKQNKLYKFKSAESIENFNRDIVTINNNELWFSGLESLNDPFEKIYATRILEQIDSEEEIVKKFCLPLRESVDAFYKNVGIFSTCTEKTNLVMWSHYANNHSGYCIEYNLRVRDLNELNFKGEGEIFLFPVEYKNEPIDYLSLPSKFQFYLRRKSKLWKYENEYRLISPKKGLHKIPENTISGIYLGANINKIVENTLLKICEQKNIKLFKTVLSTNTYTLRFQKMNRIK